MKRYNIDKPSTENEMDIFSGKLTAWRVWRYLLIKPERTIADIARGTKQSYSSVYYSRKFLVKHHFISFNTAENLYIGEHWSDDDLGILAELIGVTGRSEKRRILYSLERQKRVNMLIGLARQKWMRLLN